VYRRTYLDLVLLKNIMKIYLVPSLVIDAVLWNQEALIRDEMLLQEMRSL
jgi:hypothetical protein